MREQTLVEPYHGDLRHGMHPYVCKTVELRPYQTQREQSFARILTERDHWGRLVESAVGAQGIALEAFLTHPAAHWLE